MKTYTESDHLSFEHHQHTKIIATVGPATHSYEDIYKLVESGANGIRLNFSHGTHEERIEQIAWIRKASKELHRQVAIIQDLQGPKIRLGDFDGVINVQLGQQLRFGYNSNYEKDGVIPLQYDLSKKMKRGEQLFLYDGKVRAMVTAVTNGIIHARAENDGILIKRKGINLPDTDFGGDILTKKDREDIAFGSTRDIDYVALSFVQHDRDITKLRTILHNLGSTAKIIAKIETRAAVENLEPIIQETDAVMVARGDLAVETQPESVPILQRRIIGLGIHYGKPTIVATQMLASMMEVPEPTRAEVSDVATAVIIGADCVMLSDETANGRYPIEAVKVMRRVVRYTEDNNPLTVQFGTKTEYSRQAAISSAVIELATRISARAIIAETKSGATAVEISSHRPRMPIIAVSPDTRVAQQLELVYGVKAYIRPAEKMAATKLTNWLQSRKVLKPGDVVVTASGQYPGVVGATDTIKVRVL